MQLTMALVELRGTLVNGFFKKLSNTLRRIRSFLRARCAKSSVAPAAASIAPQHFVRLRGDFLNGPKPPGTFVSASEQTCIGSDERRAAGAQHLRVLHGRGGATTSCRSWPVR